MNPHRDARDSTAPAGPAATDPAALGRVWRWLRVGLDLLVAVLLVFVALRGIASADAGHLSPATWLWLVAFAAVYAVGRMQPGDGPRWWLPAVIACFTGLAWTSADGVWLAFPLFFLVLRAVAGWYAVALVGVLTAVAIATIAWHVGWRVGGVAGPILGAAVALMVGMGFRLLMREATIRADAIDELLAARADVAEMSRRAGELDERARLAADIHDTVAQGLSSIQLLLHSAEASAQGPGTDPARTVESIRMAREVAADNLRETRRIIAALQPGALTGADLPVALARVCASAPVTADGSPAHFGVDGDPRPIPADAEAALVRVAQASIANVARHARATRCAVTLTYQPDSVSLDVVDDGIGFDPAAAAPPGAVGIAGVRRRIAALGGTVSIESAPGAGCGVSVHVPLDDAHRPHVPRPTLEEPR
ncbi:sensor histidine kinase [Corynebacterium sp. NPDC060344]|uniref:sensor histidine kinase n=1 Tax=Corynebacterium sp. NPDC060344 TaxID=3347101 RepID=UPI003668E102